MAANKNARLVGPVALTTTLTTNILNCTVTSMAGPVGITIGQPYLLVRQILITNKTALPATYSLWLGATAGNAAGTELAVGIVIAANFTASVPLAGAGLRMDSADFLVGGSNTATALTLVAIGEVGISG